MVFRMRLVSTSQPTVIELPANQPDRELFIVIDDEDNDQSEEGGQDMQDSGSSKCETGVSCPTKRPKPPPCKAKRRRGKAPKTWIAEKGDEIRRR